MKMDRSWDVSEEKDLTRFFKCLCLAEEAEEELSLDSPSEDRDLTRLRNGLSVEGKLNDLVGDELELTPFCPSVRDNVGVLLVLCLEAGESPVDSGLTAPSAAKS